MTRRLAFLCFILGVASSAAGGRPFLVPIEYPTIGAAIGEASDGDTVMVSPGVYAGPGNRELDFHGASIVLIATDGPAYTSINCESAGRAFYLHSGESRSAVIRGFSVTSGLSSLGGAMYCNPASPTVLDCWFSANRASWGGGAVYVGVGAPMLEDCRILANACDGAQDGGGICVALGDIVLRDCVVAENRATRGGGLRLGGSVAQIQRCTVTANYATSAGGGAYCGSGTVNWENCILWGNCAGEEAAELYSVGGATFHCSNVETDGIYCGGECLLDNACLNVEPGFCDPCGCGPLPCGGWYALRDDSPCRGDASPCGEQIGALGVDCAGPSSRGACCLPDGSCVVRQEKDCTLAGGVYMGDGAECDPGTCNGTPVVSVTWGRIKAWMRR